MTALIAALSFLAGGAVAALCFAGTINAQRRTIRKLRAGQDAARAETSKLVLLAGLVIGVVWVSMSYYLAFTGREQIAESLSQTAVIEIVGVVLGYFAKAAVENLSKNNSWPDKATPEQKARIETKDPEDIGD